MIKPSSLLIPASPDTPTLTCHILCVLAALLACGFAQAEDVNRCVSPKTDKRLVIIIDDIGHNLARGRDALTLPGKLNYAVIPYTRYGKELAEAAHLAGKEVLLHAPMSTVDHIHLGRGGLTPQLTRDEFRTTLHDALQQVPHVAGVNNHMGSDLTQRRPQMAWLMQELRWRDLYFVDSRTSENTVAATVAQEFNVPQLSRQVFLDNERNVEGIDARFKELLALAREEGVAVAIAHPYPETIDYLQEALLTVHDAGFRPVFVSEVVAPPDDSERILDTLKTADCEASNARLSGQIHSQLK